MFDDSAPSASATEQLAARLRGQIRSGEFPPGAKLAPLRTLTGQYGVSHITIIRAMEILEQEGFLQTRERRGTYVSDRTAWKARTRVVKILTGMNVGAAGTATERTHMHGVALIEQRLTLSGAVVSFQNCVCYPYANALRNYLPLKQLGTESADAIIAVGLYDMAFLGSLQELKKPVIVYDLDASSLRMDSACVDDAGSAFEMTSLLIKRGHKKIVLLGNRLNTRNRNAFWNYDPCLLRRAEGYALAMRSHGLPEHLFFKEREDDDRETIGRALAAVPGCEAVVTAGMIDLSALVHTKAAVATWTVKGSPFPLPGVAILAECDFDAMGEAVLKLMEARLASPDAPIQRTVIRPEIKVWKKGKVEA